jgi:hypothetical protein
MAKEIRASPIHKGGWVDPGMGANMTANNNAGPILSTALKAALALLIPLLQASCENGGPATLSGAPVSVSLGEKRSAGAAPASESSAAFDPSAPAWLESAPSVAPEPARQSTRSTASTSAPISEPLEGAAADNHPVLIATGGPQEDAMNDNSINLRIGDKTYSATLADNSSARALKEMLAEGPVTIDMSDYGNMEKVGDLGRKLPTNDKRISTVPGDLILYQGNAFVIYYAINSWNLTRLGKIYDVTQAELKEALGAGNVTVTLSLIQ